MKIICCHYSQQLEEDIIDLKASKEVVSEELKKVCILKSRFQIFIECLLEMLFKFLFVKFYFCDGERYLLSCFRCV